MEETFDDCIKRAYDRFKDNPEAMQDHIVKCIEEQVNASAKPIKIPKGYQVSFHYDEYGHIIDMTFDRIH